MAPPRLQIPQLLPNARSGYSQNQFVTRLSFLLTPNCPESIPSLQWFPILFSGAHLANNTSTASWGKLCGCLLVAAAGDQPRGVSCPRRPHYKAEGISISIDLQSIHGTLAAILSLRNKVGWSNLSKLPFKCRPQYELET